MKILVIAPHPDDEVLGCGGTIAKHAACGDDVSLCIVTCAYTPDWPEDYILKRPDEVKRSCEILGIKKQYFLDYPTVKLDTVPQKDLNESLDKVVREVGPDILYIPHIGDLNRDHRLIHEAALVAARPLSHIISRILSYEVPSETEWGAPLRAFEPNIYCDIAQTMDKKIDAMKVYSSEIRDAPHPRSLGNIEARAKIRGSECGKDYAEAFMLVREVL